MSTKGSVLITGCSDGGVGSGLALVFQERGYHVFATARNPEKMTNLKNLPNVTLLELDVVVPSQIRAAVEAVTAITGGDLTVLINNAAQFHYMPLLDDDIEAAKQTFDANVWGPLAVTQAFAPLLIKARGMVVNITSIAGHNPVPWLGVYGASKRSQEHMADILRLELSPFDVKVLSVVTGAVATGTQSTKDFRLPSGSRYKAIEQRIVERGPTDSRSRMPLMTYTNQVVYQIEAGATGKVWLGDHAEDAKQASLHPETAAQWV
ncbi:hypothetical protein NUU61_002321 [Penicillium alfredii]|uniref:Uncharacterized protein n=1 Tax=Penicillium alfredii TaxID=1506179 RepID=A0A9W9FRH5_9EURO|nr:uncharacterized protein NUU61_002321 [Penicillium alfredii]KAJ5104974.1 hypothetical protein NUU61_002321 [Penicillium alfredii]